MFQVFIAKTAEKQLKKLPMEIQRKVAAVIVSFAVDPHPYGSKKLSGTISTFRVRVGKYRIIYDVDKSTVTITVLKLGHRSEIYRQMPTK